ncbi:NAD-dependent epimerase/dehydratase family protein [Geobacter anodireducens]|uniref:NAD-dependent epimerase n=1 Tax=Geobacter soli TaxID=1510391 RepID=A0A0C1QNB0_9BACT|nr:NAD(P)-dependent oxidoreductase [Geobacter soli]ANA40201.1 NAD-dependent epimerase [Geobacter anodireducens]KIE42102.1 NAD-dependent epimerase [Geobacter soli]
MKILVTGGSGFLGSHVADALTEAGHEVSLFDVHPSPYLREGQSMINGDILDEAAVERAVEGFDVIYHFAGIADIDECTSRPVDTVKFNILGTVNLLEAARRAGIQRFVFGSSAYVYSDSGYFYRSSKQACESFIENYHELFGLKYTCLRYGSLYGTRADERNSIYRLILHALRDNMITYHGTGEELREFIHVRDAAEISVKILAPEFENQHITLTGNEKMRYRDLLDMVKEMIGAHVSIEILPSQRKAHYKITPYNFSPKLGRKLVNNPHIDMGQGLLQCMAELYELVHQEKMEEGGLLVDRNGVTS